MKAGGNFLYAADLLQVVVALLGTVTAPLILWLFGQVLSEIPATAVPSMAVLKIFLFVQLLPIALGMTVRAIRAEFADWLVQRIAMLSRVLLLVLLLVVVVVGLPTLLTLGITGVIAALLFALACTAIGHFLGGPGLEYQSTLAIGCLARNIGLALLIAGLNKDTVDNGMVDLLPAIIAFLIIGAVTGIVYSKWMTKRIAQAPEAAGAATR